MPLSMCIWVCAYECVRWVCAFVRVPVCEHFYVCASVCCVVLCCDVVCVCLRIFQETNMMAKPAVQCRGTISKTLVIIFWTNACLRKGYKSLYTNFETLNSNTTNYIKIFFEMRLAKKPVIDNPLEILWTNETSPFLA